MGVPRVGALGVRCPVCRSDVVETVCSLDVLVVGCLLMRRRSMCSGADGGDGRVGDGLVGLEWRVGMYRPQIVSQTGRKHNMNCFYHTL